MSAIIVAIRSIPSIAFFSPCKSNQATTPSETSVSFPARPRHPQHSMLEVAPELGKKSYRCQHWMHRVEKGRVSVAKLTSFFWGCGWVTRTGWNIQQVSGEVLSHLLMGPSASAGCRTYTGMATCLSDKLGRTTSLAICASALTVPIQCPNSAHTVPIGKTHSAHTINI